MGLKTLKGLRLHQAEKDEPMSNPFSSFGMFSTGGLTANQRNKTIWVYSFGRSGSTTLQHSLYSAGGISLSTSPNSDVDHVNKFVIFEPCHLGDKAHFQNCAQEMEALFHCDFDKINKLTWWGKSHGSVKHSGYDGKYNKKKATEKCNQASLRVFKTIHMHGLAEEAFPLLDRIPELYVISNVRDPRGIYQSAKKANMVGKAMQSLNPKAVGLGFAKEEQNRNVEYIKYMCSHFLEMHNARHERLLTVRFEDLIKSPDQFNQVLNFLDLPPAQINAYAGIQNFEEKVRHINHFGAKWEQYEKDAFASDECTRALRVWGYDAYGSIQ